MTYQPIFELRMHINELLHNIMIVAERQHLLDEEHQTKVTGWLIEMRLDSKLFAVFTTG